MADVSQVTRDTIRDRDRVLASWVEDVNNKILDLMADSEDSSEFGVRRDPNQSNKVIVDGGNVTLLDGRNIPVTGDSFTLGDGETRIYISDKGRLQAGKSLPQNRYDIATVTLEGGQVTKIRKTTAAIIQITNLPDYLYLPIAFAFVDSSNLTLQAKKEDINKDNEANYQTIKFDTYRSLPTGTPENPGTPLLGVDGIFVAYEDSAYYKVETRVFVIRNDDEKLSAKLSIFVINSTHPKGYEIVLAQAKSSNGSLILNGENDFPVLLEKGDKISVRVSLTDLREDDGFDNVITVKRLSSVQFYRSPKPFYPEANVLP
ncbi:hypothetical protein [Moorena sp. SIO3A2]|uniref:hypothetical protein n=1 Tax=Moorena sp. SIO3A2 TaxID=2607841 RepID=UPI0013B978B3|nr:hypothetical protein [Moorena sp. SIO3A2]NER90357.1 hypothetical protein [Moorena sp. SIO3A2]